MTYFMVRKENISCPQLQLHRVSNVWELAFGPAATLALNSAIRPAHEGVRHTVGARPHAKVPLIKTGRVRQCHANKQGEAVFFALALSVCVPGAPRELRLNRRAARDKGVDTSREAQSDLASIDAGHPVRSNELLNKP